MSSEIQFCLDCSNLLYPREDREHKQLIFLCRSCEHLQYADPYSMSQNCVDRLNYNFRSKEDVNSYIAQGLDNDPTLPRAPNWKCPKCPNFGAVYFQLPERVADDAMTLVFVCTQCTFYQVKGKEIPDELAPPSLPEHDGSTKEVVPVEKTSNDLFLEAHSTDAVGQQAASPRSVQPTYYPPGVSADASEVADPFPLGYTETAITMTRDADGDDLGLDELGLGTSDDEDEFLDPSMDDVKVE